MPSRPKALQRTKCLAMACETLRAPEQGSNRCATPTKGTEDTNEWADEFTWVKCFQHADSFLNGIISA